MKNRIEFLSHFALFKSSPSNLRFIRRVESTITLSAESQNNTRDIGISAQMCAIIQISRMDIELPSFSIIMISTNGRNELTLSATPNMLVSRKYLITEGYRSGK